uniref:Uncharacterized protein n=1 Tax=Arundo donax TaxID=35708 RepID=A0A0A9D0Y9_ARUDO
MISTNFMGCRFFKLISNSNWRLSRSQNEDK